MNNDTNHSTVTISVIFQICDEYVNISKSKIRNKYLELRNNLHFEDMSLTA